VTWTKTDGMLYLYHLTLIIFVSFASLHPCVFHFFLSTAPGFFMAFLFNLSFAVCLFVWWEKEEWKTTRYYYDRGPSSSVG
jgi:hypothetical protein